MEINQSTLTFVLGLITVVGVIITVYNSYRNPQVKSDIDATKLKGEVDDMKRELKELKETHLKSLESEIKTLNINVNELGKTVVKLATIIDERIPRGSSNLTPPGQ